MELIKSIISNIDSQIFIGFLALNLIFGLMASKGVSTMRSYSIGNKDFSTATIASTIIATWVSGEFFFTIVAESYSKGMGFMLMMVLGDFLGIFLVGKFFAPRMGEFLNKLSIAEAMGDLYGKKVRIVTAISGFIGISGIIAIQLKISGLLFEYALGVPLIYGVVISGIVITLYSSLGGIKSVTFTDVIQFISFGTIIPVIAYFLFKGVENHNVVIETLTTKLDFNEVFNFSNPNLLYIFSLFLWSVIPSFNPAIFQRVAMSKNTKQASRSFIIASMICLALAAIVCWIGILVLTIYPKLNGDDVLKVMISDYHWIIGFRGIILAGIMAMVMSTVDSYINSSSILLVHDLRQSISKKILTDELKTTRLCSMVIGSIAILFAIKSGSFLDLFIWASMFYMPVVTVPFIMTIFGFRSSGKSVMLGMIAGFSVAMLWELYINIANVGGLIPGMLSNLFVLMTSHYVLKQPGGWIKRNNNFEENEATLPNPLSQKKIFNLAIYLKKNFPKNESLVFMLGIFMITSNFLTANAIPNDAYSNYTFIFDTIYIITLLISTILVSYPLWPARWKTVNCIPIIWHAVIFIILVCFSCLTVIMSNFFEMQLILFMSNMIIISTLLHWKTTLLFVATGIITVLLFVREEIGTTQMLGEVYTVKYKFAYLLFMMSSVLFMFLKPKQEQMEETEAKVGGLEEEVGSLNTKITDLNHAVIHYSERVQDQQQEIERLGATAQKILNNVHHELRLPVGNVMNFAEMLSEELGKFNKKQLKMLSDEVFQNSNRLSTMILNMLDLATLDVKKIELQKQTINLSELVSDRVKNCRKIYLQDKQIDFEMTIEPEILILLDSNYIKQTIDNLIINAITYSNDGVIKISVLRRSKNMVEITIKDQGIGIPKGELYDIFTPFKMGTNTESKAQGRGVGLALCKSAIEAHGGAITVESEGKGALFRILLPF